MAHPPAFADEESTAADSGPLTARADEGPWVFAERYEIQALLGTGGMGTVYRAYDRELEDTVALKLIRRDLLDLPGIVERFRREVKLARKVTHRNVARVYDLGVSGSDRYFTMELVRGHSLGTHLDAGPLPVDVAVRIIRETAAGLAAAHAAGVVHRDLKPDNIILATDGHPVITDFGIARSVEQPSGKATLSGNWIGTPAYMAPELVAGGGPADEACDVYSLGAILFELLTGQLPWVGDSEVAIAIARLQKDPLDPRSLRAEIPIALAQTVLACLARDRPSRIPNAVELGLELDALGGEAPASVAPESLARPSANAPAVPPFPWSLSAAPPAIRDADRSSVKTVAVMPFDLGGNDVAYVEGGLVEAIVHSLSTSPDLRVRPRGMVERFRGGNESLQAIARQLGVQAIVRGSIDRHGETLSIHARALGTRDGFTLWAGGFTGKPFDVLHIGEQIARAVSDALSADRPQDARPHHIDVRVLDLYLRGRYAYDHFWNDAPHRAVGLFQQALAIVPDDPQVLAAHALALLRDGFFRGLDPALARAAAEQALSLGPHLAEAHLAMASVLAQEGASVDAVKELRVALGISAAQAEANWLLGRLVLEAGLVEAGLQRLEWSLSMAPAQTLARRDRTRAFALLGRWTDLERCATEDALHDDTGPWLDRARYTAWRRDAAAAHGHLDLLESSAPTGETRPGAEGPLDLARALLTMTARQVSPLESPAWKSFIGTARTRRRRAFVAQIEAEVLAYLGDDSGALAAVVHADMLGLSDLAWLEKCPLLEELVGEPPFRTVHQRVAHTAKAVRDAVRGG